jgi:hypothetical protein
MAGSSVSMLGTRMSNIALPMLALYLTGSPVAAGWTAFAATAKAPRSLRRRSSLPIYSSDV